MRDGGKGDTPRPLGVPMEEFDKNWDEIFNKKEEKKNDIQLDIEADNDGQSATVTKTWSF